MSEPKISVLQRKAVSIVRENLMEDPAYRPYTGCEHMNRTRFNGKQFDCSCGWHTTYEPEFIEAWKAKHGLSCDFADPPIWHRHGMPNINDALDRVLLSRRSRGFSALDELIGRAVAASTVDKS